MLDSNVRSFVAGLLDHARHVPADRAYLGLQANAWPAAPNQLRALGVVSQDSEVLVASRLCLPTRRGPSVHLDRWTPVDIEYRPGAIPAECRVWMVLKRQDGVYMVDSDEGTFLLPERPRLTLEGSSFRAREELFGDRLSCYLPQEVVRRTDELIDLLVGCDASQPEEYRGLKKLGWDKYVPAMGKNRSGGWPKIFRCVSTAPKNEVAVENAVFRLSI